MSLKPRVAFLCVWCVQNRLLAKIFIRKILFETNTTFYFKKTHSFGIQLKWGIFQAIKYVH